MAKCNTCGKTIDFVTYTKSDGSNGWRPVDPGQDSHICEVSKQEPKSKDTTVERELQNLNRMAANIHNVLVALVAEFTRLNDKRI